MPPVAIPFELQILAVDPAGEMWMLLRPVEWAQVPRKGERIELGGEFFIRRVQDVSYMTEGEILVELEMVSPRDCHDEPTDPVAFLTANGWTNEGRHA